VQIHTAAWVGVLAQIGASRPQTNESGTWETVPSGRSYEKIDGGKGGSYQDGHNAANDRELTLRNQRPYLTQYNMGAGGRADDPHPQGGYSIIIKK
jgi:hypothetical protein